VFLLKDGWTALMQAAASNNTEMVQLLLDKGANMEAADKVNLMLEYFS
jgi:ankyrin repeat protein